jgi:hypothetical protein
VEEEVEPGTDLFHVHGMSSYTAINEIDDNTLANNAILTSVSSCINQFSKMEFAIFLSNKPNQVSPQRYGDRAKRVLDA